MTLEPLPWDSAFFGRSIARAHGDPVAAAVEADATGVDCVYALVDPEDATTLWAAQEAGYRVVDHRLVFGRSVTAPGSAGIRAAAPADVPALEAIARTSFRGSRFANDPNFPDERCDALYVEWLRRGLTTPERQVLVTDAAEGFVVCGAAAGTGSIELIAVAEDAGGRGLGRALVDGALDRFARQGLAEAEVVTQAGNVAAQRLYVGGGFRPTAAGVWLHRWR